MRFESKTWCKQSKPHNYTDSSVLHWPINAFPELEHELLIVLFSNSDKSFKQTSPFLQAQLMNINLIGNPLRWSQQACPQTCHGGKFLNGSPFKSLFIIFLVERGAKNFHTTVPPNWYTPNPQTTSSTACSETTSCFHTTLFLHFQETIQSSSLQESKSTEKSQCRFLSMFNSW